MFVSPMPNQGPRVAGYAFGSPYTDSGVEWVLGHLVPMADTDPLADLSDDFDGAEGLIERGWSIYDPDARITEQMVANGEVSLGVSGGGASGAWWYSQIPTTRQQGAFIYHVVDGDFDMRARVRVRNELGTGSPGSAVGEWRFGGLQVQSPDGLTVGEPNYVHIALGSDPSGQNRVEWKTTDDDGLTPQSTFASEAGAAPLDYDLRIVRRGQIFRLFYRRSDIADLPSDLLWVEVAGSPVERDADYPPRIGGATPVPMPDSVYAGMMPPYAGPQGIVDLRLFVEEIRYSSIGSITPGAGGSAPANIQSIAIETSGHYIEGPIPNPHPFRTFAAPASVAMWIRNTVNPGGFYTSGGMVVCTQEAPNDWVMMELMPDGRLLLMFQQNATRYKSVSYDVPNSLYNGGWHHLVIAQSSIDVGPSIQDPLTDAAFESLWSVYVDGVECVTYTADHGDDIRAEAGPSSTLYFGGAPSMPASVIGRMDEVQIFERTLTASNALEMWNGGQPHAGVSLYGRVSLYDFEGALVGGDTVIDRHGLLNATVAPGMTDDQLVRDVP